MTEQRIEAIASAVKWALVVFIAVAALGAIHSYGQRQYAAGQTAERAEWQQRENAELVAANAKINELQTAARAWEAQHARAVADVSKKYQEEIAHEKSRYSRALADLRSGALRLRVPVDACGEGASSSASGATGPATGGRDGAARADLSDAATEFLLGLASDADQVTRQLSACQRVIEADRHPQSESDHE